MLVGGRGGGGVAYVSPPTPWRGDIGSAGSKSQGGPLDRDYRDLVTEILRTF